MNERLRVIVSAFGATGHAYPALALARELRTRGHEVAFECLDRWRGLARDLDLRFWPAPDYVAFPRAWPGKPDRPTLPEVVRSFIPTMREFEPDVVVNDFFALPAALAAEVLGLRRATLIPHPYPPNEPGLPYFLVGARAPRTLIGSAIWRAARPWFERRPVRERRELNAARAELGLPAIDRFYGGISEQLAMVATFPQLEYPRSWPAHVHVTGPLFLDLPHPEVELPLGDDPLVVIAGSTAQDQELSLVRIALDALEGQSVRVLATLNQKGRNWHAPVPANAEVVDWVSYSQVLPDAAVIVCNGGHGTVVRSLADGVPVLVCPGPGDMAMNGARVAWAGAGLMVPRELLRGRSLRWAVRRILDEPRFAARARAIAAWHRENNSASRAATLVERHAQR